MFKNRGDCDKVHRDLAPGQPCDIVSKAEADDIVTPNRASRGRSTTPAAKNKTAQSNSIPLTLTPPSTSAQPSAAYAPLDPAATPTPTPFGTRLSLSVLGSYTPEPSQEATAEQQPEDNLNIGDDVVRPSPSSDSRMGDYILVAPRQPIVFERQPSSASTVLVPETPLPLAPAPDEVRPSNVHDPPQRHDSAGPEDIAAATPSNIAQHMTDLEIQHLRRSRAQYADELEESTGLVNQLQTRRQILEADAILNRKRLGQLEADRRVAQDRMVEAEQQRRTTTFRLHLILALLVSMVLAYSCWCVYRSPEMEYIMKRREEVLRE